MKRLCFLSAAAIVAMSAVSCDDGHVEYIESRDPDDVTGTYEVDYRVFLDGNPVTAELPGRVVVSGEPIRQLSMEFWPDAPVLTVPSWDYDKVCESLDMRVSPVGQSSTYIFDCRSTISLEYAERSGTSGPLTMSGKIEIKSSQELVDDGYAYYWEGSCLYKADLPDSPDVYHHLTMTIDFEVVDPMLPPGTEIFPDKGIGVHKFHIEITSK